MSELQGTVEQLETLEKGGEPEDFERLLEEGLKTPKEGEIVEGRIVKITPTEVYVDIGAKSEGVVPIEEFKDPESLQPGQTVKVYVDALDGPDGRTQVSKHKADFLLAWDKISEAYRTNQTIEAKVRRQVKGGLMVEVFGVDAFLPGSQLDVRRVRSIASFVGKTIPVKVIKLNKARKNIVVSRKEVIEEEQEKLRQRLMELKVGQIVEGVVKNLTDFGAFVDIGGIDALIHINDLSWKRINHPSEVVEVGQRIEAQVLEVDPENLRVSLSLKHLQPHPWEEVARKYPIGSKVEGVVKKIVDYGAFVELEPGVEGLVHISEMSWGRPPRHPSEILKEGEKVEVVVLAIDIERQRISLGLKQAKPDPWSEIEEKYPVGSEVKGTIRDFANYGAYVEIEDGIEGFLHVSDISWTQRFSHPSEALKKGQRLRFKVIRIDKRNRFLELSLKDLRPNPWIEIERQLPRGTTLTVRVLNVAERGLQVEVDKGLMGFIPASQLWRRGDPRSNYKEGEELTVQVLKVEPQRKRVLLSEREYYKAKEREEARREREEMQAFFRRAEPARINLGEILQSELEKLEELISSGEEEEKGE